jgi:hypothetical protein
MSARCLPLSLVALMAAALVPAGEAAATPSVPAAVPAVAALIPRAPAIGSFGRPKAEPRPVSVAKAPARPSASPKPKASPAPQATPKPPAPTAAQPPAVPSVQPATASAPAGGPAAEGALSTWVLPGASGQGYDFSFTRPTWSAEGALWWGDWGVGAAATAFGTTYASFQATPYFEANTWMVDALIKRRFADGRGQAFAGYRGIGLADLNFATVGAAWKQPVSSDWLFALAQAQAGHSFSGSYVLDGRVGLQAFLDPLTLDLGFRHLALQAGARPLLQVNGPVAGIGLRF